jgi:hypothetical protein
MCGRAAAVAEGGGGWRRSDDGGDRLEWRVDNGGVESGGDLECFGMKSETTWGGLLFIGSKISAVVLGFLTRTTADNFRIRTKMVLV